MKSWIIDIKIASPCLFKLFIYIVFIFFAQDQGFNKRFTTFDVRWPAKGQPNVESRVATWDGAHYLKIAQKGYNRDDPSCAFYPLWPFLIFLTQKIFQNYSIWFVLAVANLLTFTAYVFLSRLIRSNYDIQFTTKSIWLHTAIPGSMFLCVIYTEPLFFLLSILVFYGLSNNNNFIISAASFFLPLTKAIGFFIIIPIFLHLVSNESKRKYWVLLFFPFLGYAMYFLILYVHTNNPLSGFEAQQFYPAQPSISKIFDLSFFVFSIPRITSFHDMLYSGLDRFFFILLLLLLPKLWNLNKLWFIWALLAGVIPALSSSFMSYTRHFAMVFPVCVVITGLMERNNLLFVYYVILFYIIEILLLYKFVNFQWAG